MKNGAVVTDHREINPASVRPACSIGRLLDTGASTTGAIHEPLGRPNYIARGVDELGNVSSFNAVSSSISWNAGVGYCFESASRLPAPRGSVSRSKISSTANPRTPRAASTGSQQDLRTGRAFCVEWTRKF